MLSAHKDSPAERHKSTVVLLLDELGGDQIGMGLDSGLLGTASLAGAWEGHRQVVDSDQGRQASGEPVTEECWDSPHQDGCCGNDLLGHLQCARANPRRQNQATRGRRADPDPLPAIIDSRRPLAILLCGGVLATHDFHVSSS